LYTFPTELEVVVVVLSFHQLILTDAARCSRSQTVLTGRERGFILLHGSSSGGIVPDQTFIA
jgi:hypothetical protein